MGILFMHMHSIPDLLRCAIENKKIQQQHVSLLGQACRDNLTRRA